MSTAAMVIKIISACVALLANVLILVFVICWEDADGALSWAIVSVVISIINIVIQFAVW